MDPISSDPFCNQEVIDKQRVFAGKKVTLLYNYKPLGNDQLHFLIVPKEHRETFTHLTQEEYLETAQLASKVMTHFREKGFPVAHLFHKSGSAAGQTVPHWHLHLILSSSKEISTWEKVALLKNMIWGTSPLSDQELAKRVRNYQQELQKIEEGDHEPTER